MVTPSFPFLDRQSENQTNAIDTVSDNGTSGFWATEAFSAANSISHQHYNKMRDQIELNATDLVSRINPTQMVDITVASLASYNSTQMYNDQVDWLLSN